MIPRHRPTIRRADMDAVLTRLAEDAIGAGNLSREFSQTLAKYVGKRSGVSMRSVGAAYAAALDALQLEGEARIGVSVLAPEAVYHAIRQAGFLPVPIDSQKGQPILPSPLDFDYQQLELAALIVEARLGYVADLESFAQLRVPIVEDVSEGLGGNTGTNMAGSVGELTVVGLEPEHIVTVGGGAVVLTSNNRRVSILNAHSDARLGSPPIPDMNAALGLTQLKQLESFVERRKEIAARFVRTIQRGRHSVPFGGGESESVFPSLPVLLESSPRDVEQYARGHGVTVERALAQTILSLLEADAQAEEINEESISYPNALALASRMVVFPLYPTLTKSEQERIERVLATMP